MHPVRKQRLILILFIVVFAAAAAAFLSYALRQNLNLYKMPNEIAINKPPVGEQFIAGGCVVPGSFNHEANSMVKRFLVTDGRAELSVMTEEVLPDLFAEGETAVLTGALNEDGIFVATEVNAKHDENYVPPEVAEGLQGENGGPTMSCEDVY